MKYKYLFFDLDNTLYDFSANSKLALHDALEKLDILPHLPSFEEFYDVYHPINDRLWGEYREKKITKDDLRAKRMRLSLDHFKYRLKFSPLVVDDKYLEIMPSKAMLMPNTLEVLAELKRRGYQMLIITNGFLEVQSKKMKTTHLAPYFSHLVISEVVKVPKPDAQIFEYAMECCKASPSECVMIGDSLESDILGAQNAGIDQIYYNWQHLEIDESQPVKPSFIIDSLLDLLDIL